MLQIWLSFTIVSLVLNYLINNIWRKRLLEQGKLIETKKESKLKTIISYILLFIPIINLIVISIRIAATLDSMLEYKFLKKLTNTVFASKNKKIKLKTVLTETIYDDEIYFDEEVKQNTFA